MGLAKVGLPVVKQKVTVRGDRHRKGSAFHHCRGKPDVHHNNKKGVRHVDEVSAKSVAVERVSAQEEAKLPPQPQPQPEPGPQPGP